MCRRGLLRLGLPVHSDGGSGVECAQLRTNTKRVHEELCDIEDAFEVFLLASAPSIRLSAPIRGVSHAAGALSDGMLRRQGAEPL